MKIWVVFAVATFLASSLICLPLRAADSAQSDAERLKILEDAVRQLQQRNAEQEQRNAKLEAEVRELKSRNTPFAPVLPEPDRKATAGNANKADYYIHGEGLELMANYVHTWSDFREANPEFGDDQFDEVLLRMQVIF
jgi:cell division protein FtsB